MNHIFTNVNEYNNLLYVTSPFSMKSSCQYIPREKVDTIQQQL